MKPIAMPEASLADHRLSRRRFLTWGALVTAMSLAPHSAVASRSIFQPPKKSPRKPLMPHPTQSRSFFQPGTRPSEKAVALYNSHTGESLNATYWVQGQYLPEALSAVDRVLRDHRTDEIKSIDPQVLDLLYAINEELECRRPFYIISAYRSPTTNAYLRFMSRRVAEHSLHMDGKAVDLRLPGWASYTLRRVAVDLQMGGVGYYPRADFIHVDVGPVRYW
jgi:uncharacterized protein YcbK (DUF882 family)